MTGTFVFIEGNTTGSARDFFRASERFGRKPVIFVTDMKRYPPGYLHDLADVVPVDTHDLSAIVAALEALGRPVDGVSTSSELWASIAARVAQELELPGPCPDAVQRCRDKAQQLAALSTAGVGVPRTVVLPAGDAWDPEALGPLEPPLVVKPAHGTGSVGVKRCETHEAAIEHARELAGSRASQRDDVLVQELVDGPEFSAELIDGRVIAVLRKHLGQPPAFVEIGHDFLGTRTAPVAEVIAQTAEAATEALGLTSGPAHAELRIGAEGPVVIEINPRLAGGQIPTVVQHALGIDLVTETMRGLLGGRPRLDPIRQTGASVRFLLAERPGIFQHAEGVDDARRVPGVVDVSVAARGKAVKLGDFRQRVGHVLTVERDGRPADDIAHDALSCLRAEVA